MDTVHSFAKLFTRLKMWNIFGGQGHWLTGFGVSAYPRWAIVQGKTTKTSYLYALTR